MAKFTKERRARKRNKCHYKEKTSDLTEPLLTEEWGSKRDQGDLEKWSTSDDVSPNPELCLSPTQRRGFTHAWKTKFLSYLMNILCIHCFVTRHGHQKVDSAVQKKRGENCRERPDAVFQQCKRQSNAPAAAFSQSEISRSSAARANEEQSTCSSGSSSEYQIFQEPITANGKPHSSESKLVSVTGLPPLSSAQPKRFVFADEQHKQTSFQLQDGPYSDTATCNGLDTLDELVTGITVWDRPAVSAFKNDDHLKDIIKRIGSQYFLANTVALFGMLMNAMVTHVQEKQPGRMRFDPSKKNHQGDPTQIEHGPSTQWKLSTQARHILEHMTEPTNLPGYSLFLGFDLEEDIFEILKRIPEHQQMFSPTDFGTGTWELDMDSMKMMQRFVEQSAEGLTKNDEKDLAERFKSGIEELDANTRDAQVAERICLRSSEP